MGAIGLPGDLSSPSRFVRAAFTKLNAVSGSSEEEAVRQFFHILSAVAQTRGCARAAGDRYEYTVYTSCCNMDRGIYYYTTYENSRITAVDMHRTDLDGKALSVYPLATRAHDPFSKWAVIHMAAGFVVPPFSSKTKILAFNLSIKRGLTADTYPPKANAGNALFPVP